MLFSFWLLIKESRIVNLIWKGYNFDRNKEDIMLLLMHRGILKIVTS